MTLETNFIGSKIFLFNESTTELQSLRDRLFKETKVKNGKRYQLNAVHSFSKALDWSKRDKDMSYENILRNFQAINFQRYY